VPPQTQNPAHCPKSNTGHQKIFLKLQKILTSVELGLAGNSEKPALVIVNLPANSPISPLAALVKVEALNEPTTSSPFLNITFPAPAGINGNNPAAEVPWPSLSC